MFITRRRTSSILTTTLCNAVLSKDHANGILGENDVMPMEFIPGVR